MAGQGRRSTKKSDKSLDFLVKYLDLLITEISSDIFTEIVNIETEKFI
jgi:hypothetical protein